MKHLLKILIVGLLFNFSNLQSIQAQHKEKTLDSYQLDLTKAKVPIEDLKYIGDCIEKEIYDQFDRVAKAASTNYSHYRSLLLPNATASSQGMYHYTLTKEVDSIIQPALSSFDHYSNYTNLNDVRCLDAWNASQTVQVHLFTDTSGHTPRYNHLKMDIHWVKQSSEWKIENLDRYLSF